MSQRLSPEEIDRFGADPQETFARNLAGLRERIAAAALRAGRDPAEIRLLAVSKTVPASALRAALAAGISDFGENKVQEGLEKSAELAGTSARWSVIGHLQSNKINQMLRFAHEFHALDSLKLAEALDRRLEAEGRALEVLVQVNTSGEESKSGLPPEALPEFLDALPRFARLRPRGLMTLAALTEDQARIRECFRLLRRLRDEAVGAHPEIRALSMGMSGDFEAAVEEGATILRLGSALFGARNPGPSITPA
ncbi:YggS family pyridoxal phosphate-dependent enzyme [Neomegalonema sp.]|uniref:YggS family pyridoxal phosphate-dependent enzyme n=1 Tax=Neomegalonema sp. TaxID=2039713 RepID=UPI00262A90EB|nr:YggS family pyridoxal phosphate-dependent enzyme [Neomegalonema sp.]MDD2867623.1 YggS family pyridoxal phosphate-dependent enzyme [Neomegalonema sp.]